MASNFVNPTGREALNDHKVDALTTKNNNLKMRRVVNASPAINSNDYVIKSQVDSVNSNLSDQISLASKAGSRLSKLVSYLLEYGTHADRLSLNTGALPDGSLFYETDRSNVGYQLQSKQWYYTSGEMAGTLSPDQRPTDLGANDKGFLFRSSDSNQLFKWTGSAWTLEVWVPSVQQAVGSSTITLTSSYQTIPGTQLTLAQAGTYLITGVFYLNVVAADQNATIVCNMVPTQPVLAPFYFAESSGIVTNLNLPITQCWVITISGSTNIALQAYKSGGTGNSVTGGGFTTITALWVHP